MGVDESVLAYWVVRFRFVSECSAAARATDSLPRVPSKPKDKVDARAELLSEHGLLGKMKELADNSWHIKHTGSSSTITSTAATAAAAVKAAEERDAKAKGIPLSVTSASLPSSSYPAAWAAGPRQTHQLTKETHQ